MPSLNVSFYKLMSLMKKYIPNLFDHFVSDFFFCCWKMKSNHNGGQVDNRVQPSMFASQWFLTIFCVNCPFDLLSRIWDIYLLEGEKTIYRFGIAILKLKDKELMKMNFEDIMKKMKSIFKEVDLEKLIQTALSIKITRKILEVSNFWLILVNSLPLFRP